MRVIKGIDMFGGIDYDCNVFLIDGELIVDTASGNNFNELKKEIENICDPKNIKIVVNTHCHFDHTGGNKKFRDWLKAEIAIHEKDKDALENGETLAELFNASARTITVDRILREKNIIKTTNFSFEVISTPGHTPGSICLYEREKRILISGDTLFEDGIGRTDFPNGSTDDMKKSLEKLSRLDINYLLPGHGNPKVGGVNFLIKQILAGVIKEEKFK